MLCGQVHVGSSDTLQRPLLPLLAKISIVIFLCFPTDTYEHTLLPRLGLLEPIKRPVTINRTMRRWLKSDRCPMFIQWILDHHHYHHQQRQHHHHLHQSNHLHPHHYFFQKHPCWWEARQHLHKASWNHRQAWKGKGVANRPANFKASLMQQTNCFNKRHSFPSTWQVITQCATLINLIDVLTVPELVTSPPTDLVVSRPAICLPLYFWLPLHFSFSVASDAFSNRKLLYSFHWAINCLSGHKHNIVVWG